MLKSDQCAILYIKWFCNIRWEFSHLMDRLGMALRGIAIALSVICMQN